MRRTWVQLMLSVILPAAVPLSSSASDEKEPVRHVVVFKYKQGATKIDIQQVTDAFRELKKKIPGIQSFEHGVNNSPEGKNLGFTHIYLITFENSKARDVYLPHPDHKKFVELIGKLGVVEDVFVVDYVPGK